MTTTPLPPAIEPVAWFEYARKKPTLKRLVFDRTSRSQLRVAGWVSEPLVKESDATQARADLEAQLKQLGNVFGHLGTADECGNEWIRLQDENQLLREALDSLAERFSNMDANGDKWISTVAAAAMTLRALEKQP